MRNWVYLEILMTVNKNSQKRGRELMLEISKGVLFFFLLLNKQELIVKEEASRITLMFMAEWLAQLLMRTAMVGKDKHKWQWESLKMRLAGEPSVSGKEYFISDLVEHCLHMVTIKRKWFLFGLICLLYLFIYFFLTFLTSHTLPLYSLHQ